jgi:hypothetical protein
MFFSISVYSKEWPCLRINKLPQIMEGCEGEACGILRYEKVVKDVEIYKSPFEKDSFKTVDRCQKITYFKPLFIINKPGKIKFIQPMPEASVRKGDTAIILSNVGEGYVEVCLNDKTVLVSPLFDSKQKRKNELAIVEHWGETEGWIKAKFSDGTKGYLKNNTHRWYQGYYDYEPKEHCSDPAFPDIKDTKYPHSCPDVTKFCSNGKAKQSIWTAVVFMESM